MAFEAFIGGRYLRIRRKQAFISLITLLSVAGVAVGVMALIVVIAVMAGFEADLKERILAGQAHVVVEVDEGYLTNYQKILSDIEGISGVVAASPFIYIQTMLRSSAGAAGALLRGIDPRSAGAVLPPLENTALEPDAGDSALAGKFPSLPGIVLGRELARNLGVGPEDNLYVIAPRGMLAPVGHVPSLKRFRVRGFFESGLYEFDGTYAFVRLEEARKLLRIGDGVNAIQVRVAELYRARAVASAIAHELQQRHPGNAYRVRDWTEMNRSLFSALRLEKLAMFVILVLIILVAAFNITSALIMLVMEKGRDIAILKAMGATDRSIRRIFVFRGMVIGIVGTLLGAALGYLLCGLLKNYDIAGVTGGIYYLTAQLPVRVNLWDTAAIVAAALLLCYGATLYPAYQASHLDPVEAIRYA
jgi:lipoprotein-releasing system permease protein